MGLQGKLGAVRWEEESGVYFDIFGSGGTQNFWGSKNFFLGAKCLILGEQQYFVWYAGSQNTKCLYMLKIWGVHGPLLPLWLRPCSGESEK